MKTKRILAFGFISGVALLVSSAQPVFAKAPTANQDTTGKVNFKLESPTQPPVGPGPIVPPGPGPAGSEDLRIVYAMDFDFGTKKYDSASPKTVYANKGTFKQVKLDEDGNVVLDDNQQPVITKTFEGPLGVSISNSSAVNQWSLSVKTTPFKQADATGALMTNGKVLDKGMMMTLHNVYTNTVVGAESVPSKQDIKLTTDESVTVGTYTHKNDSATSLNQFVFGGVGLDKPADPSADPVMPESGYKGVSLYLPKGMDIKSDEYYVSTLTWTLEDTE